MGRGVYFNFTNACRDRAAAQQKNARGQKKFARRNFFTQQFFTNNICSQLHGLTKDAQHGESLGVKTGGVAQRLSNICRLGAALDRK